MFENLTVSKILPMTCVITMLIQFSFSGEECEDGS
jgi:hypothetical protein